MTLRVGRRWAVVVGTLALLAGGGGLALAVSIGSVSACASVTVPAQTISANGATVGTIPAKTASKCVTTTYTIPDPVTVTNTVTQTVTVGTTTTTPPPSGSKLTWAPPGLTPGADPTLAASYPGYTVVNAPQGAGTLTLDNSTDYFIKLGHPTWSSWSSAQLGGADGSELDIVGGRNRVIVGGQIDNTSTNNVDDIRGLLIDGGNPAGITHIEGVAINSVNALTIRSPQTIQIENDRFTVSTYQDDFTNNHPDVIQTWDGGRATLRIDHLTGTTDYTGLSVLLPPWPISLTVHNTNLHHTLEGNMLYFGYDPNDPTQSLTNLPTQWTGEAWFDTGWYNASYRQKLDDVLGVGLVPGSPYELHGLDGASYTSPNPAQGGVGNGSNPVDLGRRQGDTETWSRVPAVSGFTAHWGVPPGGDFVPAGVAGVGYVSPGYQ